MNNLIVYSGLSDKHPNIKCTAVTHPGRVPGVRGLVRMSVCRRVRVRRAQRPVRVELRAKRQAVRAELVLAATRAGRAAAGRP